MTSNAVVTVTVDGANDAPVAANDGTYVVSENRTTSPVTAPGLLANDTDVDAGTTLTAVKNTDTVHGGTVTVNANGTFSVAYAAGSTISATTASPTTPPTMARPFCRRTPPQSRSTCSH